MPTTFANTINGNEILAKRAERDYAGNDLQTTYATKTEVSTGLASKEDSANKAQTLDPSSSTDFPSSAATANYVNSSVATATANFLGNFTLTELGLTYPATDAQIGAALDSHVWPTGVTPTNNDYTYIEIQDPQTTGIDDRVERFKFNGTNWVYEYTLNNSSFTSQEKAAIDSGIDSAKVTAYDAHVADSDIHVTLSDKSNWNAKQDTISDLATIRSGAQAGASAVQPGDLATVATTGDYSDLLNKPDLSVYAESADLATVATTGAYSDLSGTPTIPTATSDLTNDSGFITLSDVPAQVNADWNSSSGASEILNKPTIPSGAQLVPAATSADEDKVLTVDSQGVPGWASAQAPISAGDGVDITSNVVSAKVDGTTIDTNASGELTVIGGGGGGTQADWTEDDPADPSYIENKPTPKTLTGGTNITVTENSSTITISATWQNAQADWTESDPTQPAYIQHKPTLSTVATTGAYSDLSGTPTIPTVDQMYDASSANAQSGVAVASGISDAVAALPTNLTSAQIQSLKEALGVDETVLWSGMKTNGDGGNASYTLSETPLNFQYIKVYVCASDNTFGSSGNVGVAFVEWDTQVYTAPSTLITLAMNGNSSATALTYYRIEGNISGIRTTTWGCQGFLTGAASNARWFHIYKIVGVHRIASN